MKIKISENEVSMIFKKYNEEIFRYIYFRIKNKEEAQDLTSDTFIKFINTLQTYDPKKSGVRTWLYLLAKSIMLNHLQKRGRILNYDIHLNEIASNSKELDNLEYSFFLLQKLDDLQDTEKDLIVLRFINELEIKEIAKIYNKNYVAIKVAIHRAVNKLKKIINE